MFQKGVIQIFETWRINRITVQNVQKLQILAVLASSVASILNLNIFLFRFLQISHKAFATKLEKLL